MHLLISFIASVKYIWNYLQSKASGWILPVLHGKRACLSSCMFIETHGNYDLDVGTVLKRSHICRVKNAFCHLLHTSNVCFIGLAQICILTIEGLYRICTVPWGDLQGEGMVCIGKSSGQWLSDKTYLLSVFKPSDLSTVSAGNSEELERCFPCAILVYIFINSPY